MKKHGLIMVNTGSGKGKTTAAFGTAIRAAGHGSNVLIVQFLKGRNDVGEIKALSKFPNIEIHRFGSGFTWLKESLKEDRELAKKAWTLAKEKIKTGNYDLIVLDELNVVIHYGFLSIEEIVNFLETQKPPHVHIFITGRNAKKELIEIADMVTEMNEIKHHFKQGIPAQKNVEF